MSDRNLTDLCPQLQILCNYFVEKCFSSGIKIIITETYRSESDQNNDYAQGRTLPGRIITNAQGGQSPHNCALPDGTPAAKAFDFAIQDATGILDWDATDPDWQAAIAIGEALGLVSGSSWHTIKDNPHFELLNWGKVD